MTAPKHRSGTGGLTADVPRGVVLSMRTHAEVSAAATPLQPAHVGKYLWTLSASTGFQPESGNMPDAATVRVRANTEADALSKAALMLARTYYRVQAVEVVTP